MNKYFNRIEYGKQIFYKYKATHYGYKYLYAMVGYLTSEGYSCIEAADIVWEKIKDGYPAGVGRGRCYDLSSAARSIGHTGYTDVPPLSITIAEVENIFKAIDRSQMKLLFSLLCFVKYRNFLNKTDSDWVSSRDLQKASRAAGLHLSSKSLNKMIYDLKEKGFIVNSNKISSSAKKILYRNENSDPFITVDDLRGLGSVWTAAIDKRYMRNKKLKRCALCDAPFIDRSKTLNAKYCSVCKILPKYKIEDAESQKSQTPIFPLP